MEKETDAVKQNLRAILATIKRLDEEFPLLLTERKRRSVGYDKLLNLMDDFNNYKTGVYLTYLFRNSSYPS